MMWLDAFMKIFGLKRAEPEPELPAPVTVDRFGWLHGDGVTRIPSHSSWFYAKLSTATGDPVAIVAHATATAPGTAINMARRRVQPRKPDDRAASWHISIEADGSIVQQASCRVGCWHAVGSIKGAGAANRVSVGIELVGFERGPWPPAQVEAAKRVWMAIVQHYGIKRELAMVPHAVIDPERRSDPGRPWMRDHAEAVLEYAYRLA
jgi:N-acetyl-anhydromuramyl-L-alanine amidase AmpD